MKRILLKIQYDGTDYAGFQKQANAKTIQEELEKAIFKLFKTEIEIFGCSRTDSGVSAEEYYAHFDVETTIYPTKICYAINQFLPLDIRVLESKEVDNNFHARFSVKNKTYVYSIYLSEHIMPLLDRYSVKVSDKINLREMTRASSRLIGEHDFSSFKSQDPSKKDTNSVRKINFIKFQNKDNIINIFINGNGFLYNMVRIIVGTLLEIGKGKIKVEDIDKILLAKSRQLAGPTMPPKGLKLLKVNY